MIVEKIIPKKRSYVFPKFNYVNQWQYRYDNCSLRTFNSRYEYWFDGRLFLIGGFSSNELVMVEAETFSQAVTRFDFEKKPSVKDVILKFKSKLSSSGKTIHEVVQVFKSNNLDLDLWLIKSLSM